MVRITDIVIYPVKSCAGISVQKALCGDTGLLHDREWAIVDKSNKVLTQREVAKLALIETTIDESGNLTLRAPGLPPLEVAPDSQADRSVELWGDVCVGVDQGDQVAHWLSEFSGQECRLIRGAADFRRRSLYGKGKDAGPTAAVQFADSCPLLVVGQESLADLNERLDVPVPMNRFRPSIVIEGLEPYGEDTSRNLRMDDVLLTSVKPCPRCVIITIDQADPSQRQSEPLKVLAEYRTENAKVMFGQYFSVEKPGWLRVGQVVDAQR